MIGSLCFVCRSHTPFGVNVRFEYERKDYWHSDGRLLLFRGNDEKRPFKAILAVIRDNHVLVR